MTENHKDLFTIDEIETQSTINMIEEIKEISLDIPINPNRFRILCNNVQNCLFEIDNSMFELLELKDKLLLQYLPRNVLLKITLVFSRFTRSYSQSQISIYELIRLTQLYSQPFDMKCGTLKTLYDSNEIKKRMLNIALQKLTSMENNIKQYQEQKILNNWEKMYIRLALPRSNIRKWKFRIKTFREKAELGYEHVIEWLHTGILRIPLISENLSHENSIDNRNETSIDIINKQDSPIDQLSDDNNEISLEKSEEEIQVTKVDIEIQTKPNVDDQQTSTDDILSTKSIIMRIYRPIGILKTKFQCIVHAQGQDYITDVFTFNKSNNVSKDEIIKTNNQTKKSMNSKIKKTSEVLITLGNIDINKIDQQQNDEFLISMPNILKRRSLFQTDTDPDAIKIDIYGDEKFYGSVIFSSDDLRMLDLPNLYSSISSPLIAIDETILIGKDKFDFDHLSNEIYQSWISHTPQTFTIYNDKHELIGKLPLLMFWYNKIENIHATKSTMTTPFPNNEDIILPVTTRIIDENIEPYCFEVTDDHIEIIKATYENEIAKLHENYQTEIQRLKNLLNEMVSRQSSQIIQLSETDENTNEIIQENLSNTSRQQMEQQTKCDSLMKHESSSVYGRDPSKDFLERYQMNIQRSIIHRQQLIAKVEQENALINERQMEIQHRLYRPEQNIEYNEDLCLPAVFMPFRSGNVFNPRAYRFFHSIGTNRRLTQSPSILKLPSLPSRSVSVLNLFELSRSYDNANEKDRSNDKTSNIKLKH